MPVVESAFRPPWWWRSAHLQSVYPVYFRPSPALALKWERVELKDGDFIDLCWNLPEPQDRTAPIVAVLPGLGGSIVSKYARGVMARMSKEGARTVLVHARGASGVPNRKPRAYHAGAWEDPAEVLEQIRARFPEAPLFGVGFSLGGNVLLDLVAEVGPTLGMTGAVAVSVPMDLSACAGRLKRGLGRIYDAYLLRGLKDHVRQRRAVVGVDTSDALLARCRTVWDFDELVNAPLHGFEGAEDYYARSSSRPRLARIEVPTLVVQAFDDPMLDPTAMPEASELSEAVTLEIARWGGHVGFVEGSLLKPRYWIESRVARFIEDTK